MSPYTLNLSITINPHKLGIATPCKRLPTSYSPKQVLYNTYVLVAFYYACDSMHVNMLQKHYFHTYVTDNITSRQNGYVLDDQLYSRALGVKSARTKSVDVCEDFPRNLHTLLTTIFIKMVTSPECSIKIIGQFYKSFTAGQCLEEKRSDGKKF